ncbi:hypothetical protein [Acaryochloris sp. IP29b_bin.148]|uniref:hypothetical protein n=1 Tax=Acaryochloris sp. IP29b_bin.148 TaxID=2969218 RepID=UPI0026239EB9|nr:hypothetical protein [Acaryochloris sp. IP29b_bin.148]
MDKVYTDWVTVKNLDTQDRSLLFRVGGQDRAGVVAKVTGLLEDQHLYVEAIQFNLILPEQNQFEMEILARGALEDLTHIRNRIQANQFLEPVSSSPNTYLYWPQAHMMHLALNTPDQEGLIARISNIVSTPRDASIQFSAGNFVHLVGITHNSDGPQGGTAYFSVRANIASQSLEVQHQIQNHLLEWAKENCIEGDMWIRDLNP